MVRAKKSESDRPSELEMQILSVLWNKGSQTVRQVLDSMPDRKTRAYTTILSMMQIMNKKGLIEKQGKDGTAHVFAATRAQDAILKPLLGQMVENFFFGNRHAVVQMLYDGEVSQAEMDQIKAILDKDKKLKRGGS